MNVTGSTRIPEIIQTHEADLLSEWVAIQLGDLSQKRRGAGEKQTREDSQEFLRAIQRPLSRGQLSTDVPEWAGVHEVLERVARSRLDLGHTPSEVATFVFSFKRPLFSLLQREFAGDAAGLARETWAATEMIDNLGLFTTEVYQRSRNEVILRQQEEMLELSTPVVELWEGVLALPLIGTLDSARTQIVMQNLLQAIVETGAEIAIIDITGVPTVDTLVAQHLLKTVAAARLMGADCIISGIRPQIAQTIIHLGVDLKDVITKSTLADAFSLALRRTGAAVVRSKVPATEEAI